MAENTVKVDIVAENAQLKQKLAEAEAAIARLGKKGAKEANEGIEQVTRSARALSFLMKLVTIPTVAITSAVTLARILHDIGDNAKGLRNEFKGIGEELIRSANVKAIGLRFGDQAAEEAALRQQAESQVKAVVDALEAKMSESGRALRGTVGKALGIDQTDQRLISDAKKQIANIEAARDEAIKNAQVARERARKSEVDAATLKNVTDDRTRLRIEGEQVYEKYLKERRATADQDEKKHLDTMLLLYKTHYDQRLQLLIENLKAQEREIIESIKRQQTAGFSLGDLNFGNSGTDTALQALGDNFVSTFRNHGGGM